MGRSGGLRMERRGVDEHRGLREFATEPAAQATLEYALTVFALLAVVVGIAALWRAGEEGALVELVEDAVSHALSGLGALDIALY